MMTTTRHKTKVRLAILHINVFHVFKVTYLLLMTQRYTNAASAKANTRHPKKMSRMGNPLKPASVTRLGDDPSEPAIG